MKISPSRRLKSAPKKQFSFSHFRIDVLIWFFFEGRPRRTLKQGLILTWRACRCCFSTGPAAGVYPRGSGGWHKGPGELPPQCSVSLSLSLLCLRAEQQWAFTAEELQRRRQLIRVKQAIESWFFVLWESIRPWEKDMQWEKCPWCWETKWDLI